MGLQSTGDKIRNGRIRRQRYRVPATILAALRFQEAAQVGFVYFGQPWRDVIEFTRAHPFF